MDFRELFDTARSAAVERDGAARFIAENVANVRAIDYSKPVVTTCDVTDGMDAAVSYMDRAERLERETIARCDRVMSDAWVAVGFVSRGWSDESARMISSYYLDPITGNGQRKSMRDVGERMGYDASSVSLKISAAIDWLDSNYSVRLEGDRCVFSAAGLTEAG